MLDSLAQVDHNKASFRDDVPNPSFVDRMDCYLLQEIRIAVILPEAAYSDSDLRTGLPLPCSAFVRLAH